MFIYKLSLLLVRSEVTYIIAEHSQITIDIFKYASYFVLTLCVFTLTMVLIHAFDHKKGKKMMKIMRGGECEMMGNEGCGPGKGNKMYHYNMHDNGSCPMMKKGDCCEGDERGNVKSEKEIIINKDTIVVK